MSVLWLLISIALPCVVGYAVVACLRGVPRGVFAQCAAWGDGSVLGIVGFGALLGLSNGVDVAKLFPYFAPVLLVAGVLLIEIARRRSRSTETATPTVWPRGRARIAAWGLLGVLAIALVLIASQALLLPTYTWDAWSVWLAKPKAWYHLGTLVPAVSFEEWSRLDPGQAITTTAWKYPEALSRFVLWVVSAYGAWSEAAAHAIWPLLWCLLGLSCFGHLGRLGLGVLPALCVSAGLLTLPLIMSQATLAGYMDLWLGTAIMIACLQWLRWRRRRGLREALLAVLFSLLLPLLKQEGAIWLLCLMAAVVLSELPRRWSLGLVGLGIAIWLAGQAFGGLPIPVPGLGVLRLGWDQIVVPGVQTYRLAWQPVGIKLLEALYLLPNWSLLFYLAPVVIALRWRGLFGRVETAGLALFLAFGAVFLFVLFFLTAASAWVTTFSAVNRLVMHLVPVFVVWLSLLWTSPPAARDRDQPTAA